MSVSMSGRCSILNVEKSKRDHDTGMGDCDGAAWTVP